MRLHSWGWHGEIFGPALYRHIFKSVADAVGHGSFLLNIDRLLDVLHHEVMRVSVALVILFILEVAAGCDLLIFGR